MQAIYPDEYVMLTGEVAAKYSHKIAIVPNPARGENHGITHFFMKILLCGPTFLLINLFQIYYLQLELVYYLVFPLSTPQLVLK
jgi:hypothetical protein